MTEFQLLLPKLGESITDATIITWLKQVGERVEEDEPICEIATDKVDSEVPSPVAGIVKALLFEVDAVVGVGKPIAIIDTSGTMSNSAPQVAAPSATAEKPIAAIEQNVEKAARPSVSNRFYSPLARKMAEAENLSLADLDSIAGTGENGRVRKADILNYLQQQKNKAAASVVVPQVEKMIEKVAEKTVENIVEKNIEKTAVRFSGDVEIIEMDRMRKLIAKHMVESKRISPHVTSFVEVDMTKVVQWRERNKKAFEAKYGTKITYTPIFVQAIVKAIKDFPQINASVEGDNLIIKKNINIGIAAALPNGNLIVPVIKNADFMNLQGLAKATNDLVEKARNNRLKPDDIQDGTYTLTNVGTFGNIMGTPIINQPQVAIMATGVIQKKPAVIETPEGDFIGIRHKMFLSHAYDHRVVDGFLGGSFLRRVADYLENFEETI
jgi:2-oxoglutarate dehydrogenase E2 component (dihydrolipoamide succinyltransferase)